MQLLLYKFIFFFVIFMIMIFWLVLLLFAILYVTIFISVLRILFEVYFVAYCLFIWHQLPYGYCWLCLCFQRVIPFHEVTCVRRAKVAGIFPTAIEIFTEEKKVIFTIHSCTFSSILHFMTFKWMPSFYILFPRWTNL